MCGRQRLQLCDATGSYVMTFCGFASVVAVSSLLVLTAVPPGQPDMPLASDAGSVACSPLLWLYTGKMDRLERGPF
jgi:hypothetical protein